MLKEALSRMADIFSSSVLMQGLEYEKKGFVLNIRLSEGLLKARVKDTSSHIYNVYIDLRAWPKQPACCNCPAKKNCQHAAASLFALKVKENIDIQNNNFPAGTGSLERKLTPTLQKDNTYEIVYLFDLTSNDKIRVNLALSQWLKRPNLNKKTIFHSLAPARKQYFTLIDDEIITTLALRNNIQGWFDRLIVHTSFLLEKILLTQRAYLLEQTNSLLIFNKDSVQMHWHLNVDGTQQLIMGKKEDALKPLFLDKLWYYDKSDQTFGIVEQDNQIEHLKWLFNLPLIKLSEAPSFATKIAEMNEKLPRPTIYENRIVKNLKPKPIIILDAQEVISNTLSVLNEYELKDYRVTCQLVYDYAGIQITGQEDFLSLFYETDSLLMEVKRDLNLEQQTLADFQIILDRYLSFKTLTISEEFKNLRLFKNNIYASDLPKLYNEMVSLFKSKGWLVHYNQIIFAEAMNIDSLEWFSKVDEQQHHFFSYNLGILIEGKPVSIIPLVAKLLPKLKNIDLDELEDDKKIFLSLSNKNYLQVPLGRLKPLLRFLLQYHSAITTDKDELKITRYQLMLMYEAEQAMSAVSLRWQNDNEVYQQLKKLIQNDFLETMTVPSNLKATLRDYQFHGLSWLQSLRRGKFGGILADDMGLGKTIQTLAHLQLEKEQGRMTQPSLIIAPTSVITNWSEEAKRFTPGLKVLIFHGSNRQQNFADYDLIISTYSLIQRDKDKFVKENFYYFILDEAQFIKNNRAKVTQIILQIQASYRLCLSGTPLENHLGELWSLFHFLMPGLLGDIKQFRKFFKWPIEKQSDQQRAELLMKRIRPFMLRRTKNQVAQELPEKIETTHKVELFGEQRDLYEAIRISMQQRVRSAIAQLGLKRSHIVVLDALLKLRQVCCDPRLLSVPGAEIAYHSSAKLEALMTLVDNLVAENRRILIFSQFTSMLKLIEEKLINCSYDYLKLTGQTKNRLHLVNKFQEGNTPIFLISLKAGGTGLNLTQADTVIHYDPWWNPSVENQATDRSHRIGQRNTVFVYKLITLGTVEEVIVTIQNKKKQLFEGILTENLNGLSALTEEDIDQFFAPFD
ncbi:DNA helicase, SNF2/RAD54 family domain protein [Legionella busanensis]|uniref:DNA helicase, SNF2/RAD54 family domain protein n=1 Tax=Legionella busanensis TaxID=190655 RepID=A0A378JIQ4_9GAMM|nr:DEAD/DEAH box helicase [Legionella busanensis]STX51186.1 DNA helicase, SNF2/RAD54 family domain protein [Legionella busanensis]